MNIHEVLAAETASGLQAVVERSNGVEFSVKALMTLAHTSDFIVSTSGPQVEYDVYEWATDAAISFCRVPMTFAERSTQDLVSESWELAFSSIDELMVNQREPTDPAQRLLYALGVFSLVRCLGRFTLKAGQIDLNEVLVSHWDQMGGWDPGD